MSEFPSLVIFPSNSKSDSRKFPVDLPINSSNVLWFILANLTPSQRLLGLLKTCNYKVNLFYRQSMNNSIIQHFLSANTAAQFDE